LWCSWVTLFHTCARCFHVFFQTCAVVFFFGCAFLFQDTVLWSSSQLRHPHTILMNFSLTCVMFSLCVFEQKNVPSMAFVLLVVTANFLPFTFWKIYDLQCDCDAVFAVALQMSHLLSLMGDEVELDNGTDRQYLSEPIFHFPSQFSFVIKKWMIFLLFFLYLLRVSSRCKTMRVIEKVLRLNKLVRFTAFANNVQYPRALGCSCYQEKRFLR
jgi:hypothetical protein